MKVNYSNPLNIEKTYQWATPYLFFALFSGFILYQLALAYKLFPAFLGGYFGVAGFAVAVIYLPRLSKILKYNMANNLFIATLHCGIFTYALLVTVIAISYDNGQLEQAITQSLNTLILWFALFSLGFYFLRSNINKSIKLNYSLFLLFLGFVIFYMITTKSVMLSLSVISDNESNSLTGYQSLARNLLVISIFLISYSHKSINTLFLITSFTFIFFFLGARSEFVAFILLCTIFMFLKTKDNINNLIMTIIMIIIILFLFYTFQSDIMESRQFQLFDYSDSSSWNVREDLEEAGLKQIKDNPLFGIFGGHALNGSIGNYIHNSLSGYVNYGLFFYVGYMVISIYTTLNSFLNLMKQSSNNAWMFSFLLNVGCLFLVITTKPVFWAVPFFAWGVYFSVKSSKVLLQSQKDPAC